MNFSFYTSGEFLNWLHDCKMHRRRFCTVRSVMELIEYSVSLCRCSDCHYLCSEAADRESTAAAAGRAAGGGIKWISRPTSKGPSIQSGRGRNHIRGAAGASSSATHSSGNITPAWNSTGGNTEPIPAHGGNGEFLTSFALSGLDVSLSLLCCKEILAYGVTVFLNPFVLSCVCPPVSFEPNDKFSIIRAQHTHFLACDKWEMRAEWKNVWICPLIFCHIVFFISVQILDSETYWMVHATWCYTKDSRLCLSVGTVCLVEKYINKIFYGNWIQ